MVRHKDTNTADLLSWTPPDVHVTYDEQVAGRGRLDNKVARLIGRALQEAKELHGLTRSHVVARMGEFLGRRISEEMLNKWASEATDNRIPLVAFIALIEATKADQLLGFVPEQFDHIVVPEKYRGIIELHLIEVHEAEIEAAKSRLMLNMRGVK